VGPVERLLDEPTTALYAFLAICALSVVIGVWDRVSLSNRNR
jgi:hypothetical protein